MAKSKPKAKRSHRARPSHKALGRAISELRHQRELTQADIAKKTGLHISYISDIEGGKRNPTWTVLTQFSSALGVKLSELVERAEQS